MKPTSSLRRVRRSTITDEVENQLREAILSGALPPGHSLAEAELARQMGVNRASIRQAKFQLSQEGLLEFDSRGTASVRVLTESDIREIIEFREVLDVAAVRLACAKITPDTVTHLEELIEQTEQEEDLLKVTLLDIAFHDAIMHASGNSRLYGAWQLLRPQLQMWLARMHRLHSFTITKTQAATGRAHRDMLAALESGDGDQCELLARQHANGLKKSLLDWFASNQEARATA